MTDQRFHEAVELYGDMVFRLAYSYLKNRADAEDVMQESLLKLYVEPREFESPDQRVQEAPPLPLAAADRSPGRGGGGRGLRPARPVGAVPAGDGPAPQVPGGGVPLLL